VSDQAQDASSALKEKWWRTFKHGQRLGKFASVYFLVLALLDIGGCLIGLIVGGGLRMDLTPLILLAVAVGLRQLRNGARIVALVLCGGSLAVALAMFELALIGETPSTEINAFGHTYQDPSSWALVLVVLSVLAVFAVPFGVLLHPAARCVFKAKTRFRKLRLAPPDSDQPSPTR
jgi:hypothetical protein